MLASLRILGITSQHNIHFAQLLLLPTHNTQTHEHTMNVGDWDDEGDGVASRVNELLKQAKAKGELKPDGSAERAILSVADNTASQQLRCREMSRELNTHTHTHTHTHSHRHTDTHTQTHTPQSCSLVFFWPAWLEPACLTRNLGCWAARHSQKHSRATGLWRRYCGLTVCSPFPVPCLLCGSSSATLLSHTPFFLFHLHTRSSLVFPKTSPICSMFGNQIGDDGCKALAAVLRTSNV